jgi:hypothetical protein
MRARPSGSAGVGRQRVPITFPFTAKLLRLLRVGLSQPPSKEDQMAYDDARVANADLKETHDLIASDKVEGTKVYDPAGEHIGSIHRILLEKHSGKVSYAVLSFGGFLGIGEDHYPLPWSKLNYDQDLGGYRVDITKEQLEGAPKYESESDDFFTAENGRRVYDYYGVTPYWI